MKLGTASGKVEHAGGGKRFLLSFLSVVDILTVSESLASFMLPLIPAHQPISVFTPSTQRLPRSVSMIAENASSAVTGSIRTDGDLDVDTDLEPEAFDATVSGIYESFKGPDLEKMILLEKLDEEEGQLMNGI